MPQQTEVFANQASGTVTTGGSTTSDTAWTVTATNAFAVASTSTTPNTVFYVVDPAAPTEIIQVTVCPGGTGVGQSWTVVRGAQGTTAVTHAANFTIDQVVTAGSLSSFKQASAAIVSPVTVNTTSETVVATYQPFSGEVIAGTSFEAIAFGSIQKLGGATTATLTWRMRWGGVAGTVISTLVTGTNSPALPTTVAAGSSFDCNGTVIFIDTTHAVANINFWYNTATATTVTSMVSVATSVAVTGTGPLVLTAQWSTVANTESVVVPSPLIYRTA